LGRRAEDGKEYDHGSRQRTEPTPPPDASLTCGVGSGHLATISIGQLGTEVAARGAIAGPRWEPRTANPSDRKRGAGEILGVLGDLHLDDNWLLVKPDDGPPQGVRRARTARHVVAM